MNKNCIGVVGVGLMGGGIAAIFLAAGWEVQGVEIDVAGWDERKGKIESAVRQLGGTFVPERLRMMTTVEELDWTDIKLVLEAVPEQLDLKVHIFSVLDKLAPRHVPIGTNASGLRITNIARDCQTRERMANTHFFAPAHLVPAVEVVRGEFTDPATVTAIYDILKSVGRMPVRVNRDVPGFLANRIQHAMNREVFSVLNEGLGSPEDIDIAVRYGFGFRLIAGGPLLQKEFSGLDTQVAAARSVYPSLCTSPDPAPVLLQAVAEGRLGLKTGHGFWKWTPERAQAERERFQKALLAALKLLYETKASTEEDPSTVAKA